MISTKIHIDTSEVTKAFNKIENGAKATGKDIDNAFKIDVDTSKVDSLFDNIKKQASSIGDSFKSSFDLSQIMNFSAGGLVTGAVEGAIGGIVAGFSSAIEKGNEFNNALLDLQAKTGATAQEMQVLEQSAKDLFIGGVGESVAEATKIMGEAQIRLGDVFSGKELADFTTKANALGKQFDLDVNEVIKKSAPFIKQYGLTGEEAFNLVAMSMKEGTTASDDILDSLAEYSQLTKNAGYSAQQFTDILTRGTQEGIFNTDKLADSIKEAEIRIKAGDFKDAFKGISAGATKAEQALIAPIQAIVEAGNRGEISIQETLQKSTKLIDEAFKGGKISESLASQLQVAVAGTPAEDIGTELFGKIFGAPIDEKAVSERAKKIGDNLSKAVGQYTTFDATSRKLELFVTETGQVFVKLRDDVLKFLGELLNSTVFTYFGEIFQKVKEAVMPLINEIGMLKDEFMALFGGVGEGLDIFQIMQEGFKIAGSVIGTFIQIALQPLLLTFRAIVGIYRLVYAGIQLIIDWFKKLTKESGLVASVINGIKDGFNFLITAIKDTVGWVGKFLEKLGLISKDKPLKEVKDDTKAIADNTAETTNNIVNGTGAIVEQKKEVKTLQQQYDELYQATIKLANAQNFGTQYENNIKKLEELKDKLKDLETAKAIVDFRFADNTVVIPDTTLDGLKSEINTYFEKEKVSLSLAPIKQKELFKILPENELKKLSVNLSTSLTDAFGNLDYSSIFKKKENSFDESLENDRVNLLTSLQKNELSYEEYSERLNEIDRNRRETQKEGNSEFLQGLNDTLSISFETANTKITETLTNSMKETDAFTTGLSDNITLALMSVATATTEMALSGDNLLKSLVLSTIKAARAMFNAYMAPLLAAEVLRENWLGLAKFLGYQVLGNSFLSVAEGYANSFKDGVINLQGAGTGTSDSINARLSAGESVITAKATQMNEPFLRFANRGGDLGKLFSMNINNNNSNLESLMIENNNILRSKNLSVNNVNKFNVSSKNISIVRGR